MSSSEEGSSSVSLQSASDVMESSSVCEETDVSQMNVEQVKLQTALQELKELMSKECFKSAECLMNSCIDKTPTDPQNLLNFFTLLKKDKGKKKAEQEKQSQSKQTAKVKVYSVVTGQTFGAHQVLLGKVKNMSQSVTMETTGDLQKSHVVIVFCPIASRVGSDVEAAMTDVTGSCGQKPVILVLMHHTRDVEYSTDGKRWSDVYDSVVLDVHVLFHETKSGLLTCPKNDQAVGRIQKELQKHKEEQKQSKSWKIWPL